MLTSASLFLPIFMLLASFLNYSGLDSEWKIHTEIESLKVETETLRVSSCGENLSSEYLEGLSLKNIDPEEDPVLLQYYFWPTSFCIGECVGPTCCEIVIIVVEE